MTTRRTPHDEVRSIYDAWFGARRSQANMELDAFGIEQGKASQADVRIAQAMGILGIAFDDADARVKLAHLMETATTREEVTS